MGFADAQGIHQDRLKDGLHVGRRATDHAQHFAGRRLLLQGLGQFLGSVFDLLLQVGVGLLQLRGHLVELVGQDFDLVAGFEFEPVT